MQCERVPNSMLSFYFTMIQQLPSGPRPPHCREFIITLRHKTLGRTPLDEWSARRRDLYLTTHNTHNKQTSMPPWCLSDRASWIDYILNTNLMQWLLFIHKILFSSTCFEPQVIIFRRIQLYTCSIWYCHSLWEFLVACRYTAWVRTVCGGGGRLVGRQSMPPAAFELVIPASERPQAHALDRAADGIGTGAISSVK